MFALNLDNMEVVYQVNEEFNKYKVLKILECDPNNKVRVDALRTEPWLIQTQAMLAKEHLL